MRDHKTRWPAATTGCPGLTNHSQSCTASESVLGPSEFSCSGTAETVKGEGPLSFDGDDGDPDYRMGTPSVGSGTMDLSASTTDGGEEATVGGLAYGAKFTEAQ